MGDLLLKTFQTRLSIQKQLNPTAAGDEFKTRRLLYNCCATLANGDSSLDHDSSASSSRTARETQAAARSGYQKWGATKPTHHRFEQIHYADSEQRREEEESVIEYTHMVNERPASNL
jgi:hypothetical protein